MLLPIRLYYIFTTRVIVLIKLNNMLLKVLVIILSIVAITLGLGGDTSIRDTNLQLVMVCYGTLP